MQRVPRGCCVRRTLHQATPLCPKVAAFTISPSKAKPATPKRRILPSLAFMEPSNWHQEVEVSIMPPAPPPCPAPRPPSCPSDHTHGAQQQRQLQQWQEAAPTIEQLEEEHSWHELGECPEHGLKLLAPGIPAQVQMLQAAWEADGNPMSASEVQRLSNPINIWDLYDAIHAQVRACYFFHKEQLAAGKEIHPAGSRQLQQLQQKFDVAMQDMLVARAIFEEALREAQEYHRIHAAAEREYKRLNAILSCTPPPNQFQVLHGRLCLRALPPKLSLQPRTARILARTRSLQQQHIRRQKLLQKHFCWQDLGECEQVSLALPAPGISAQAQMLQAALEAAGEPLPIAELQRLSCPSNQWELNDLVTNQLRREYWRRKQLWATGKEVHSPGSAELKQLRQQYDIAKQQLWAAREEYDATARFLNKDRRLQSHISRDTCRKWMAEGSIPHDSWAMSSAVSSSSGPKGEQ